MAMPVEWFNDERTIIKVTIKRDSTWDEYYDVINWIVAEITKAGHRVDIIFHDDVGMPKGNPIPHLKWGSQKITSIPNSGHTIIAGSQGISNSFVQLIMGMLAKAFVGSAMPMNQDKQLLFMSSLEEALTYLQEQAQSKTSP